ncbi:uncharacterized protein LOC128883255 isoform X2 [Hylaeus volcanicus]|uniref:uncharacterized protein LOC128883255 isoform X2 n=1 Tax=Hylaeus volcanicus TaxID=313075 RepID=UPI0023B78F1B|nr:uncharacterized protein LOC128883255 isoform X2 [Hylaeus volcanicus]
MAQTQWEVTSDEVITKHYAARIARQCANDIKKFSSEKSQCKSLVENLSTFITNVVQPSPNALQHYEKKDSLFTLNDAFPVKESDVEHNVYAGVTARGIIKIHPGQLSNVEEGICTYIAQFLLKFLDEFNGVWIAYVPKSVKTDPLGFSYHSDKFGIISFRVELKCLIFRPSPNSFIVGVVNHIRDTHVALLVDGMFSACIKRDQLDLWYTFLEDPQPSYALRDDPSKGIRIGCRVCFQIERCCHSGSGEIMIIDGYLTNYHSVSLLEDENPCTHAPLSKKKVQVHLKKPKSNCDTTMS